MSSKTTVRVVFYADQSFEEQWNDQVIPPRREDWREFVMKKVNERINMGKFEHTFIEATPSLRFLIVMMPGSMPDA
jgi:hypothetical protein